MTASSSASSPEGCPAARVIRERLEDPRVVFVFPSEITARFWLRRAFAYSRRRTLRADRFLDWGDFKRTFLSYEGGGRAVNRAGRTAFAWHLLEENRRQPFFRELIPPDHSHDPRVFLPSLVRILPTLGRLPALAPRWPEAGRGKRDDLLRLYHDYRRFLEGSGLYEPSYESPHLETKEHQVVIFFPEVIEDFREYAALIAGHRDVSTVAADPLPPPERVRITVWDTLGAEIEGLLGSVESLLDRGVDPEDVVVSAVDLTDLEPLLVRRAELRALPLVVHRSRPVTWFPTARLFARIREAVDSRLSLETLRDLLLNRALPWRRPELAEGLVRLGLDNRLLRSLPAREGDGWEQAFRHTESIGNPRGLPLAELRRFYRNLKRRLIEIHGASSFRLLKERLTAFALSSLDTARWEAEQLGAFQFALDKLDELQEAASGELPAYELWLSYLADEPYLPRRRAAGVPVYDYPVAEGVFPPYHFLLNASQEGTSRRRKPLPVLNPYEEEGLGIREQELGPEHLRLFLGSGEEVAVGYSRQGLSRSHLPPSLFATRGSVAEAETGGRQLPDPELRERLAWTGGEAFRLVEAQQEGFRHAEATALAPRGADYTRALLGDPALAEAILDRLRRQSGKRGPGDRRPGDRRNAGDDPGAAPDPGTVLRISPTALEGFHGCPFAYLLEAALDLEAEEYTVVSSDPRELGAIMHRVFERFVRALQEPSGGEEVRLEASRREEYRGLLLEEVQRVCGQWARRNPLPFAPLWLELQDRAKGLALAFLEAELAQMKGACITDVELRLEARFAGDPEVMLVGKIDRVSAGPEGTTIVDYKKRNSPSGNEIFGPEPSSFQMPFYLHLLSAHGRPAQRAAYYSIEEQEYRFVLGKARGAEVDPAVVARTLDNLVERIQEMVLRLRGGDYTITAETPAGCRFCDHTALCRRRYLLGRPS